MNLEDLKVSLVRDHNCYWKYFNDKFDDHEMRMAKLSSRVFPYLNYQIRGLNPDMKYTISIHFEMTSKRGSESVNPPKRVQHERGLLSGKEWMKGGFSFISVRISSHFNLESESVIPLHVHRKYRPVVSIREEPTPEKPNPPVIECRLAHTEFFTVTQFQNEKLRVLKAQNHIGRKERMPLLKREGSELPIFATCTFAETAAVLPWRIITPIFAPLHVNRHLPANKQMRTATFGLPVIRDKVTRNGSEGTLSVWTVSSNSAFKPFQNKPLVETEQCDSQTDSTQPRVVSNNSLVQFMHPPTSENHSSLQFLPPTVSSNNGGPLHNQTPEQPKLSSMTGHAFPNFGNFIPHPAVFGPQFTFPMMPTQNFHPMTQPHPFGPFNHLFNPNFCPGFPPAFMPCPQLNPHGNVIRNPPFTQ